MKKTLKKIMALLLCAAMALTLFSCDGFIKNSEDSGIGSANSSDSSSSDVTEYVVSIGYDDKDGELTAVGEQFNKFLLDMFISEVSSDTINLHYTLKDPSKYGIEDFAATFGVYTEGEETSGDVVTVADVYDRLIAFDYDQLIYSQQLAYDVLKEYLTLLMSESEDIVDYGSYLDYLDGIQGNLPVTLAEYQFYTEKDVTDYLALLELVPQFFEYIIDYENERITNGLGLCDRALEMASEQCADFVSETENNYLISTFNTRIGQLTGLAEGKAEEYKTLNKNAVLNSVITAFSDLKNAIDSFKGKGVDGGLSSYTYGKEYYEFLLKQKTGSDKTPEQAYNAIKLRFDKAVKTFSAVYNSSPAAYNAFYNDNYSYGMTDPQTILTYLQEQIKVGYPAAAEASYEIKYVEEALEDSLSPAFYMIPPIDDYKNNVIYINNGSVDEQSIFYTLAHEGYPGHLYQTTYFNSINKYEIRGILNFNGYSEGWATYVEMDSFNMVNFGMYNTYLTSLLQSNTVFGLALSCLADIGVNYYGWSQAQLTEFFTGYVNDPTKAGKEIYDIVVASPVTYLQYFLGYMEIDELSTYAKSSLGNRYTDLGFRTTILNAGPCQFTVLKKAVDGYISDCNAFYAEQSHGEAA